MMCWVLALLAIAIKVEVLGNAFAHEAWHRIRKTSGKGANLKACRKAGAKDG